MTNFMHDSINKAINRGTITLGHDWGTLAGCTLKYNKFDDIFDIVDENNNVLFCRTKHEMLQAANHASEKFILKEAC